MRRNEFRFRVGQPKALLLKAKRLEIEAFLMSQDKDKDAKGMCSCCGNMGKEQPKNPA